MINTKWKIVTKTADFFCSFESVALDHHIVTAHFKLSIISSIKGDGR